MSDTQAAASGAEERIGWTEYNRMLMDGEGEAAFDLRRRGLVDFPPHVAQALDHNRAAGVAGVDDPQKRQYQPPVGDVEKPVSGAEYNEMLRSGQTQRALALRQAGLVEWDEDHQRVLEANAAEVPLGKRPGRHLWGTDR
jgi:hypothetical protein